MGTPEFAVPCLQHLIDSGYEIPLVVTQPDRPAGRGQKLQPPPIKVLAEAHSLPVIQPESLKKSSPEKERLLATPCDFLVVVAFGQILPDEVLNHPRIAPLNVHASLLPAYRGAAPIQRCIIEGDEKTGVTIQWMIAALDQGDILYQLPCEILEDDTSQTLHDRLKEMGATALIETLKLFEEDKVVRRSQDARIGTYAMKLTKAESLIKFDQQAFLVHRAIMGLNPWPSAECRLQGKILKIHRSRFLPRQATAEPGTIIETNDSEIVVACHQGCVSLLEVQLENRNRMKVSEFLKGHPLPTGLILGSA